MSNGPPLQTSVVIPCFNGAAFVESAIESCLTEGVPRAQIIVIDDGSTDETPQVLRRWADQISVLQQVNAGASSARNAGLGVVETRHVIFLDADDLYEGGILGALEAEMLAQEADLGLGPQQGYKSGVPHGPLKLPPNAKKCECFVEAWLSGNTVGTNSQMWRTSFLREIGGWREDIKMLEEIEIVLRGVLAGAVIAVSDKGQARYIDHGNTDRVSYGNSEAVIQSTVTGFVEIQPYLKTPNERSALGQRFYIQARAAFRQGYVDLGREALFRARECGFHGHLGTRLHRVLARLIGLENKERWSGRKQL